MDTGLGERILRFATTRENDGEETGAYPRTGSMPRRRSQARSMLGVLTDVGAEEYLPRVTQAVTSFRVVTSSAAMFSPKFRESNGSGGPLHRIYPWL